MTTPDEKVKPIEEEISDKLPCPEGDIFSLPTKAEIINAFNEIAALPGKLFGKLNEMRAEREKEIAELYKRLEEEDLMSTTLKYWVRKEAAIKWQQGTLSSDLSHWQTETYSPLVNHGVFGYQLLTYKLIYQNGKGYGDALIQGIKEVDTNEKEKYGFDCFKLIK